MAGSYNHCINPDFTLYANLEDTIENLGDAYEAIEEMVFMINFLAQGDPRKIWEAREAYFASVVPNYKGESFEKFESDRLHDLDEYQAYLKDEK